MKKISILVLLIVIINSVYSQEINKIIFDEVAEENILFGYCDKEAFLGDDFNHWFQDEFNYFNPDFETLEMIDIELFFTVQVKVVMGTWCEDSQREVPRFIKILEYLGFDFKNISIIGVDKNKTAEGTEVDQLNIEFVPTIIFYAENKEIGRIIESPVESLEQDIVGIISGI